MCGMRIATKGSPHTPNPWARCSMKVTLPVADANGHQVAVIAPVEKSLARILLDLALEEREQVVAVDVHLERLVARLVAALLELLDDIRVAGRRGQGREHVLVREDLVGHGARLDHAGPANGTGHSPAALEVGGLLAAERRRAAVWPAHHLGAVVGRVHHDGVVGDAELVELVEQLCRRGRRAPPCRRDTRRGRSCPRTPS